MTRIHCAYYATIVNQTEKKHAVQANITGADIMHATMMISLWILMYIIQLFALALIIMMHRLLK